ncbi:hypothetical protein RJI07_04660 [Mycoplasmatota bacterium WC30]
MKKASSERAKYIYSDTVKYKIFFRNLGVLLIATGFVLFIWAGTPAEILETIGSPLLYSSLFVFSLYSIIIGILICIRYKHFFIIVNGSGFKIMNHPIYDLEFLHLVNNPKTIVIYHRENKLVVIRKSLIENYEILLDHIKES